MWTDLLLQAAMILVTLFMFLLMHNVPQKFFSKLRLRNRAGLQAKSHFVAGAQLLTQSKAAKDRSTTAKLAKSAESEADAAIALDPKDAAAHILKALALEVLGFNTAALDAIDAALSPPVAKSLTDPERADALFKRAQLRLELSRRGRVDSAVEDLVESVRLKNDNAKAFCLLGDCYEKKGLNKEAQMAYEDALKAQPNCTVAQDSIKRLGS